MRQETQFEAAGLRCVELTARDVPALQRFFEANPEYFLAVNGRPAGARDAQEEFEAQPPIDWPFEKKWFLGFVREDGSLAGMADVVSNLFVKGVWHVGLFMVATSLHGSGTGAQVYRALEAWMRSQGAGWVRLGVVVGNARAERFWERMGYVEVRRRYGVEMGLRVNDLCVMAKPLDGNSLARYFELVVRDRPE